jgi:hypothetical protein
LVDTISAPVAISGFDGGSNLMNQMAPAESRMVNPGVIPSLLPEMTVHGPAAGPLEVSGPRRTSSADKACTAARFVNQLESGTSSAVFTLTARRGVRSPGLRNVFSKKSYGSLMSQLFTSEASWVSGSTAIGSSGK